MIKDLGKGVCAFAKYLETPVRAALIHRRLACCVACLARPASFMFCVVRRTGVLPRGFLLMRHYLVEFYPSVGWPIAGSPSAGSCKIPKYHFSNSSCVYLRTKARSEPGYVGVLRFHVVNDFWAFHGRSIISGSHSYLSAFRYVYLFFCVL